MSVTGGDRERKHTEEDHIELFKLWRCGQCNRLFAPSFKVCAYCPRPESTEPTYPRGCQTGSCEVHCGSDSCR